MVTFLNNDRLQKTTLTEFFTANKQAEIEAAAAAADGRPPLDFDCRELLYQEFPIHMTWNGTYRRWNCRKKGVGSTIGRMYFIGPSVARDSTCGCFLRSWKVLHHSTIYIHSTACFNTLSNQLASHVGCSTQMSNGIVHWQKQQHGKVVHNWENCLCVFFFTVTLQVLCSYGRIICNLCLMIVVIDCEQYIKSMIHPKSRFDSHL